ncbi:hypothetical protein ES705_47538 [subsurface metagenome]
MVKTKKKFACPECDKELKNARSLAGHMWFAHNIRYGEKPNLRREIKKLENEPRITDDTKEKISDINEKLEEHETLLGDVLDLVRDTQKQMGELITLIKGALVKPANPGGPNPGPEDPNPEEVKPDEEEDDGLPNFFGWLFGKKKKKDDEKESEKTADEKSWFL